jgi:hypothetical protein
MEMTDVRLRLVRLADAGWFPLLRSRLRRSSAATTGVAGVGCDSGCRGADCCAYGEPFQVATESPPQSAALGGDDGSIALAGNGREFGGIVGAVLVGGGELGLAGATILHVIVQGLQIRSGYLRGRRSRHVLTYSGGCAVARSGSPRLVGGVRECSSGVGSRRKFGWIIVLV